MAKSMYRFEHRFVAVWQGVDVADEVVVWHFAVWNRGSPGIREFLGFLVHVLILTGHFHVNRVQRAIIPILGGVRFARAPVDLLPLAAVHKAVAVDPAAVLGHLRSCAVSWPCSEKYEK
jgi:hypothetical protein